MRAGKIVGALGQNIDRIFHEQITNQQIAHNYRKKCDFKKDITHFVKIFKKSQLFTSIPGRKHTMIDRMNFSMTIKDPERLKARFRKYNRNLDLKTYAECKS